MNRGSRRQRPCRTCAMARGGGRQGDRQHAVAPGGGLPGGEGLQKPLPGKLMAMGDLCRSTYIQFNLEMGPELLALERGSLLQDIRAWLGDVEGAVRAARSLPPERRDSALSHVAGSLARHGDIARAMEMATSIESPDGRMMAFIALAEAISERQAKK